MKELSFSGFVLGLLLLGHSAFGEVYTYQGQKHYRVGAKSYLIEHNRLNDNQIQNILGIVKRCYKNKENYGILIDLWKHLDEVYQGFLYDDVMLLIFKAHMNEVFTALRKNTEKNHMVSHSKSISGFKKKYFNNEFVWFVINTGCRRGDIGYKLIKDKFLGNYYHHDDGYKYYSICTWRVSFVNVLDILRIDRRNTSSCRTVVAASTVHLDDWNLFLRRLPFLNKAKEGGYIKACNNLKKGTDKILNNLYNKVTPEYDIRKNYEMDKLFNKIIEKSYTIFGKDATMVFAEVFLNYYNSEKLRNQMINYSIEKNISINIPEEPHKDF